MLDTVSASPVARLSDIDALSVYHVAGSILLLTGRQNVGRLLMGKDSRRFDERARRNVYKARYKHGGWHNRRFGKNPRWKNPACDAAREAKRNE